jgi:sugar/nucleoside kinase (ribokinase family)
MKCEKPYAIFMGFACVDEYYKMDHWMSKGEKANAEYIGSVAGGMIANANCVAAGYGIKTYAFDIKSTDPAIDFLFEDLKQNNVDVSKVVRLDDVKDGKCLIYQFPDGDRSIVCIVSENPKYHLNDEQLEFFCNAEYVYGTIGFNGMLDNPKHLLNLLKENNVKVFFDVESNYYCDDWRDYVRCAYTVSMNEFGLSTFCSNENMSEEDLIKEMFKLGINNLLLTLGSNGCRLVTRNGIDISLPANKVNVVDCTGAGDTMNATFMACDMLGYDSAYALEFSNCAAAMSITKNGPRGGVTTIEKVEEFIKKKSLQ